MYLSSCFPCFNLITVVVKLISYKFFKQIFKEFKHIIEYFKLQAEYNILCFIFFLTLVALLHVERNMNSIRDWSRHILCFFIVKKKATIFFICLWGEFILNQITRKNF